ncbi:hypothetical protein FLM9_211 [Candidatus Synechococcus spongiarum]|uniref:Uncharacterized protein n=1 Tax=Candidatus Synechococcus spongiarum TaxID=431041 RepID=A0A165AEM2_9SYNE|nr:hypothetical protein FLM9_211 [Candidatus Synechococcus spongiarum]
MCWIHWHCPTEVHQLLEHHYRALQLDPDRSWRSPVTDDVVE